MPTIKFKWFLWSGLYILQNLFTYEACLMRVQSFDQLKLQNVVSSIHHHFQWTDLPVAHPVIAIFNLVQMVLQLLQQKGFVLLGNSFPHDTIQDTDGKHALKKYWNVAIFKSRQLNDQLHTDSEYARFRGKMTQAPVVVHKTRFIAKYIRPSCTPILLANECIIDVT